MEPQCSTIIRLAQLTKKQLATVKAIKRKACRYSSLKGVMIEAKTRAPHTDCFAIRSKLNYYIKTTRCRNKAKQKQRKLNPINRRKNTAM